MKQFLKNAKAITILILMLSLIGCDTDDDNLPEVIAGFTHTINEDTGTVTFINTSVNSKNYFWTFGDGTSSTEINPIKTFARGEYKVTLKATNVAGASDTSEDIIVISDAGAPVITLLGEPTINIAVGGTFTDPGATATDDVDGDISADIVVGGDAVDVNTAGTYIITYNVSDAAGNAATQRTRTVIVAEVALTCPETLLVLPIDFDCDGIDYASKDTGDVDFEVIDNPELSGINATPSKVAKLVFDANQQYENMNLNLDTPISFATDKSVKLKLFSSTARAVLVKFEKEGGAFVQNEQNHTGSGWEELIFMFDSAESYSNLVLFVDGGSDTTGTFYVDDIEQVAGGGGGSFDDGLLTNGDFENGAEAWSGNALNVQTDGGNSFNLADVTAAGNAFDVNLSQVVAITQGETYTLTFEASSNGNRTMLAGIGLNVDPWTNVTETINLTSTTQTFTLTLSSADFGGANSRVIFDMGAAVGTVVIDNVSLVLDNSGGGGVAVCTPETAESLSGASLNITFKTDQTANVFEDGGDFEWVSNPDFDNAVNSSCYVGKITKLGANPWDNNQIDLDSKLDFNANSGLKIKVWSAKANTEVRIKLEEIGNSGNNTEQFLTTSVTSGWEELTFPFASTESDKFDKIVIFFDLNANNTDTYYFDDLMLYGTGGGGGNGGECPAPPAGELLSNGDFEGGDVCWQFNAGGGTSELSTEQVNSGTYSAKLITGANQVPNIKMERFAQSIAAGVTVQVSFKYKFTTALGTGSILQVLAFSEKIEGAVEHNLGNATDMPLDTWNTFTRTFITPAEIADGISLLLQLTGSGNADGAGVVYIDDVQVTQL